MSAEVTYEWAGSIRHATVPTANHAEINPDGHLLLRPYDYSSTNLGIFKDWMHVVITPTRDANGRFVKKGSA